MKIGIIGLPHSGKTSIFNAMTSSTVEVGAYLSKKKSNISSVKVPDLRLSALGELFKPKKVTPTTIDYIDFSGLSKGDMAQAEFSAELIAEMREATALMHVVRLFDNDAVLHLEGSISAPRDIETINLELALADLQIIEKRLERISRELRAKKSIDLQREREVLKRCQNALENEKSIRDMSLTIDDEKWIRGYRFLTQKPLLIVCNVSENRLGKIDEIEAELAEYTQSPRSDLVIISAKLEMEISQLDRETAELFMSEMGLTESALDRVIRASYELLGLITFFTAGGKNEARAWTVKKGAGAVEAADQIHSDIARGFIRAETIEWQKLVKLGGFSEARKQGLLRLEGKNYVVQDGDVLTFRFSV